MPAHTVRVPWAESTKTYMGACLSPEDVPELAIAGRLSFFHWRLREASERGAGLTR